MSQRFFTSCVHNITGCLQFCVNLPTRFAVANNPELVDDFFQEDPYADLVFQTPRASVYGTPVGSVLEFVPGDEPGQGESPGTLQKFYSLPKDTLARNRSLARDQSFGQRTLRSIQGNPHELFQLMGYIAYIREPKGWDIPKHPSLQMDIRLISYLKKFDNIRAFIERYEQEKGERDLTYAAVFARVQYNYYSKVLSDLIDQSTDLPSLANPGELAGKEELSLVFLNTGLMMPYIDLAGKVSEVHDFNLDNIAHLKINFASIESDFPKNISLNLMDDVKSQSWIDNLPTDKYFICVIDKLLSFYTPEEGRVILNRLAENPLCLFIVIETVSPALTASYQPSWYTIPGQVIKGVRSKLVDEGFPLHTYLSSDQAISTYQQIPAQFNKKRSVRYLEGVSTALNLAISSGALPVHAVHTLQPLSKQ